MSWRRVRRCVGAFLALFLVVLAWLFLWPRPGDMERLTCPPGLDRCRVVSGRVIYLLSKDRHDRARPLHIVLASKDSLSAPGVSIVKVPSSLRPARNPHLGAWVSVFGVPHRGSNGETGMTVSRVAQKRNGGE